MGKAQELVNVEAVELIELYKKKPANTMAFGPLSHKAPHGG